MRRTIAFLIALVLPLLVDVELASAVDPDRRGERLVFIDEASGGTVVANLDGSDPTFLAEGAVRPSPDGERLLAVRERLDLTGVRTTASVLRGDGSCRIGAEIGRGFLSGVAWAPDGVDVAWTERDGQPNGVWIRTTGGIERDHRIVAAPNVHDPAWHPSGAWLAFASNVHVADGRRADIERVDRDGSDRRTLIGGPTDDRAPTFSPDGRRFAFLRYDPATGAATAHAALIDGVGVHRVSDRPLQDVGWWDDDTLVASLQAGGGEEGIVLIGLDGRITRLTTGRHFLPQRTARRSAPGADGYTLIGADGGLFHHGAACPPAANARSDARTPYVAATAHPDRQTYWYVNAAGSVDGYGRLTSHGEVTAPLAQPIVGITATPWGGGYWLVAGDGGIFSFGDATFFGSTGAIRLNQPIVGMASTPTGEGYWLVAADGGIFSFGDARFMGSTGAMRLNAPVFAMAPTATGRGYWLFARDGGVFSFGDARFHGSTGALRLNAPVTTVTPTGTGGGYWLFAADGGVFTFGDARFHGSLANVALAAPIVGGVSRAP